MKYFTNNTDFVSDPKMFELKRMQSQYKVDYYPSRGVFCTSPKQTERVHSPVISLNFKILF